MKNIKSILITTLLSLSLCFMTSQAQAQQDKYTLSGHVKEAQTGEELIAATVYVDELGSGNVTNAYGFYSLTLPAGSYTISYSYLGYEDIVKKIDLTSDFRQDVELGTAEYMVEEVVITAEEKDKNVESVEMSKITVDIAEVKKMPALFGEVDIIKTIQLLPGVKALSEGSSGFYVRGGNADQNLVLLDEAPIYNASHLLGFFSSFNPDAIKDMQLYKGAMPARYGGRLSSVLDIRMKEGNSKSFGGSAGIGTIMSRLSLEAPLGEAGSFIVSGRRSYLDLMAKTYLKARKKYDEDNEFQGYFYDLNAKTNYRLNDNNRIFLSGYFGNDIIAHDASGIGVNWGNKTSTLRWNHIFSPKLFSNLTAYYSNYSYGLQADAGVQTFDWQSRLNELSLKADFTAFISPVFTLDFGLQTIKHDIEPANIKLFEGDSLLIDFKLDEVSSLENAVYLSAGWKISKALKVEGGLRVSSLHNLGPATHYIANEDAEIIDSTKYSSNFYNSYYNFEPRIGVKMSLGKSSSIKANYNRTAQYIQQASNGNTSTPFDVWFTASPMVKPQLADQYGLGFFKNFMDNTYEASAEVYYKKYKNSIDFREGANLLLNENLEGELRFGEAKAYGLELMVKKNQGKLTGWISYTYSKIEKNIESINSGNWYNAKYDKPQDLSIVAAYDMTKRLRVASNFVYSSGSAVTFPTGKYYFQDSAIPVYSERNGARLPDYHRLDFSATLQSKKNARRRMQAEWVLGIYNVYDRKNAFAINFKEEGGRTFAEKAAIFSIVPSLTYNLKF